MWAQSVRCARMLDGASNVWLAQLLDARGLDDLMGSNSEIVGALVNCGDGEAVSRIKAARTLAPRTLPSGERAGAKYPTTASAVRDGDITHAHVKVVEDFHKELSDDVAPDIREAAERQLGNLARTTRPREFRQAAEALAQLIDEDGKPPKDRRDKKRSAFIRFDRQGKDEMSGGRMCVDPEVRALMETIFAKGGKPGRTTGDDDKPADAGVVGLYDRDEEGDDEGDDPGPDPSPGPDPAPNPDPPPDPDPSPSLEPPDDPAPVMRWDSRSAGERNHDALEAALTGYLASGALGKHRGVTCVPIVTMTLDQLESASGVALTATGTRIDVRDALRMASGQHAFLMLLDEHERPLFLGRTKRPATADQRLALYATERGCSFPGCSAPGVWCQVHHTDEWVIDDGCTDIDLLTLACERHHRLVGPGDNRWATTIAADDHPYAGRALWHPPLALDPSRTGRVNHFFHPRELLYPPEDQP
ncbi:hypothetical protein GCM10007304_37110 [Rhodococcoides trifolii]|uniref:DUF222 domain-containing protein n=1 Tax=Rhodococcoides trifolii TaxID=908250 RepID=A0A917G2Q3_9NOCA|nr:hypothetical protein GCM10007304_37110 [Rhodococcus trifolii]